MLEVRCRSITLRSTPEVERRTSHAIGAAEVVYLEKTTTDKNEEDMRTMRKRRK
jgi:hypothetical protein